MLTLNSLSYNHPDKDLLFDNLHLTINRQDKIALIGNNGSGKSSLLKILSGHLHPSEGFVYATSSPYYVPQHVGQYDALTLAKVLQIDLKLQALREIMDGRATEANLTLLNDDWLLEERTREAFAHWNIEELDLNRKMNTLSGGQKTKIFLAGIIVHQPEIILLDEPSNHLDAASRNILYDYINTTSNTLVVVTHDKALLNILNTVCELSKNGLTLYGGSYEFYLQQKEIQANALRQELKNKENTLRKARMVEKETVERKQKLDARGRKKQEKAGLPKIVLNALRNKAENSTSRMKDVHAEKVETVSHELSEMRRQLPGDHAIKMDLDNAGLHRGKILVEATQLNVSYGNVSLWSQPLDFTIVSGERIAIKGTNGSGKTTLIKMILGQVQSTTGKIWRAENTKAIYIDQDYSSINNDLTVYEQAQGFNQGKLQEHELKTRLNRFLFSKIYWAKSCMTLSGGEKMRLMLCCLMISNQAPDMIVLDEPTNNLDIQNTAILTSAINEYRGTLIVVSHDRYFLEQVKVEREIFLN